jgi:hypothetical protein
MREASPLEGYPITFSNASQPTPIPVSVEAALLQSLELARKRHNRRRDCRKFWGRAAKAIGGCGSLAAWNFCPTVARKLAVIMHRMWVSESEFQTGMEKARAAA